MYAALRGVAGAACRNLPHEVLWNLHLDVRYEEYQEVSPMHDRDICSTSCLISSLSMQKAWTLWNAEQLMIRPVTEWTLFMLSADKGSYGYTT